MSAPEGYHWSDEKPHKVSDDKYSSPILRDSVPSCEKYYAPLYFILSAKDSICCVEKCPLKQSPIKMFQTKTSATNFQRKTLFCERRVLTIDTKMFILYG